MQKELDPLTAQSAIQTSSADSDLKAVLFNFSKCDDTQLLLFAVVVSVLSSVEVASSKFWKFWNFLRAF